MDANSQGYLRDLVALAPLNFSNDQGSMIDKSFNFYVGYSVAAKT